MNCAYIKKIIKYFSLTKPEMGDVEIVYRRYEYKCTCNGSSTKL